MNENTVVLITGAGSGIGMGIARAFAAKGCWLALAGLDPGGSALARSLAAEYAIPVEYTNIDLRDVSSIEALVSRTSETLGPVSILVNNAGIQHVSPIGDFQKAKWDDVIAINLSAAFHLVQAVWPQMKERRYGRIINIASAHGLRASEHKAAYVAAKHGLLGLSKVVAIEGAAHGITSNSICPGFVETPLVEKQLSDLVNSGTALTIAAAKAEILRKQAIKEFVQIDEIASMALLLASPEMAHITGAAIPIDGGWTAQ